MARPVRARFRKAFFIQNRPPLPRDGSWPNQLSANYPRANETDARSKAGSGRVAGFVQFLLVVFDFVQFLLVLFMFASFVQFLLVLFNFC